MGPRLPRTSRMWKQREELQAEFFKEYGHACVGTCNGVPCLERVVDPEALTIAHLFNDGRVHREGLDRQPRAHARGGIYVLRDLKRRGWPKNIGIAPQCANCQLRDLRRMRKASAL